MTISARLAAADPTSIAAGPTSTAETSIAETGRGTSGDPIRTSDGTTADGWATAVSVLGPEKGLKLIEQVKGAAALIVRITPDGEKTFRSKRLGALLETPTTNRP